MIPPNWSLSGATTAAAHAQPIAPPKPTSAAMSYRPPMPAPKPTAPLHDAKTLANRRLGIVWTDIALGREAFAEHLASQTAYSIPEARRLLSAAARNEIPGSAKVADVLKSMGIVEPVANTGSATVRGETVDELYARRRAECQATASKSAPSAHPTGTDSTLESPSAIYERRAAATARARRR